MCWRFGKWYGKRIWSGVNTLILGPSWTGTDPITFKQNVPTNQDEKPTQVREIINWNHEWDDEKLKTWFVINTVKIIKAVHIPHQEEYDEFMCRSESGNFKMGSSNIFLLHWQFFIWKKDTFWYYIDIF